MNEKEILPLVTWEEWKVVYVQSKGEHMKVRSGVPNKTFWDVWKAQKDEIKDMGIYVKKNEDSEEDGVPSQWIVSQWKDASNDEKNHAKESWEKRQNETPSS